MWNCTICLLFTATTLRLLLSHIYINHSHDPGFNARCGVNGCPRTYNKYNSYYRHLHREHSDSLQGQGDERNLNPVDNIVQNGEELVENNKKQHENEVDNAPEPENEEVRTTMQYY